MSLILISLKPLGIFFWGGGGDHCKSVCDTVSCTRVIYLNNNASLPNFSGSAPNPLLLISVPLWPKKYKKVCTKWSSRLFARPHDSEWWGVLRVLPSHQKLITKNTQGKGGSGFQMTTDICPRCFTARLSYAKIQGQQRWGVFFLAFCYLFRRCVVK